MKTTLCKSVALPQAMLKVPAMILGVKGTSNQHCIGVEGGMREFAGFCKSVPRRLAKIEDVKMCSHTHVPVCYGNLSVNLCPLFFLIVFIRGS